MEEEKISLYAGEAVDTIRINNNNARYYPLPGGIIRTITKDKRRKYKSISVDGTDRCIEVLNSIRSGEVHQYFIEMNACAGACLGGPVMRSSRISFIGARDLLVRNAKQPCAETGYETDKIKADLLKRFIDRSVSLPMPDETEISKILSSIGKTKPEQELNCGGCGYPTCRDKAVAVYQGKADPKMCLPFVRERAESISNIIIDYTPNAIIALDNELKVHEVNPAALTMLKRDKSAVMGRHIEEFLPGPQYDAVVNEEKIIVNEKVSFENLDITVEQSIIYVKEQQLIFVILRDITSEEKQQQSLKKVREETLEVAQKVIDKQMRVAQEIASLLGETTAETKTALTKLKKSIMID
jgi:PAS domain S-box-containing protein